MKYEVRANEDYRIAFSDNFAPEEGTIGVHRELIKKHGFAWYGKLGSVVSSRVVEEIMQCEDPKILLIHSGKTGRYWVQVKKIQYELPSECDIPDLPEYYRDNVGHFKTWFMLTDIEDADRNVLSNCYVVSSGRKLSEVSRSSMSPYFIIEYNESGK